MNPPPEVDHNLDLDSTHITSESINLMNLDSTDYVCEICLMNAHDRYKHNSQLCIMNTNIFNSQVVLKYH